jgi:hypothetical protein
VENDVVIAGIGMVLMHKPLAGTNVKFDVANRWLFLPGEMEDGVLDVWACGTSWTTRKEQLTGVAVAER